MEHLQARLAQEIVAARQLISSGTPDPDKLRQAIDAIQEATSAFPEETPADPKSMVETDASLSAVTVEGSKETPKLKDPALDPLADTNPNLEAVSVEQTKKPEPTPISPEIESSLNHIYSSVEGDMETGKNAQKFEIHESISYAQIDAMTNYGQECSKYGSNEDAILLQRDTDKTFMIVADGAGGHDDGPLASRRITKMLSQGVFEKGLSPAQALTETDAYMAQKNHEHGSRYDNAIGTVAAALINKDLSINFLIVGDAQITTIRKGQLLKEASTKPRNAAQKDIDNGIIQPKDYYNAKNKSVILEALGSTWDGIRDQDPEHFYIPFQGHHQDRIVLASDGLYDVVSEYEVVKLSNECLSGDELKTKLYDLALSRNRLENTQIEHSPGEFVEYRAKKNRGDNISIAVIELKQEEDTSDIHQAPVEFEEPVQLSEKDRLYKEIFGIFPEAEKEDYEHKELISQSIYDLLTSIAGNRKIESTELDVDYMDDSVVQKNLLEILSPVFTEIVRMYDESNFSNTLYVGINHDSNETVFKLDNQNNIYIELDPTLENIDVIDLTDWINRAHMSDLLDGIPEAEKNPDQTSSPEDPAPAVAQGTPVLPEHPATQPSTIPIPEPVDLQVAPQPNPEPAPAQPPTSQAVTQPQAVAQTEQVNPLVRELRVLSDNGVEYEVGQDSATNQILYLKLPDGPRLDVSTSKQRIEYHIQVPAKQGTRPAKVYIESINPKSGIIRCAELEQKGLIRKKEVPGKKHDLPIQEFASTITYDV